MVAPRSNPLDELLNAVADCLTVDSARRLAALEISPDIRSYIQSLAEKANDGALSEAERAQYIDYVEAMDLVGILQAKARKIVQHSGS